jgi:hypothetical protein
MQNNKKAMRGNAWLKIKLLAPYGGITRIRFKGSPALSAKRWTLSQWLPRNNYKAPYGFPGLKSTHRSPHMAPIPARPDSPDQSVAEVD